MQFPFDFDILIFIYVVAVTIVRAPRSLRNSAQKRAVPLRLTHREIPAPELTSAQAAYLAKWDAKLADMNYHPLCTHTTALFSSNLQRTYVSPTDKAVCALMVIELKTDLGQQGKKMVRHHHVVVFSTDYPDGRRAVTVGKTSKSLRDQPPYLIKQVCPYATEPLTLKCKHDQLTKDLGEPVWPAANTEELFQRMDQEHERSIQYQLERGVYELTPDGNSYIMTDKAHWRAIRNFFNPLAQRFSPIRLTLAILAGAVLPSLFLLWISPYMSGKVLGQDLLEALPLEQIITGIGYLLAGAIIGLVMENHKFSSAFLMTYIPAHSVAGWSFGYWPYSTVAALIAFYVNQMKHRRQLILMKK